MNKLYRVLIFLVFFGLGIPCAAAANVISFNPQTVEMNIGSSQNVQIVMDEVPDGLSGFNITISILDPEIADITAVSFPSWGMMLRNSTIPSSSVWIKVSDLDNKTVSGDTNVLLGTITITGKKAGTTDLSIQPTLISADGGSSINPVVITGYISVLDKESPFINYISLSNSKPDTGGSIVMTVDVTDNVGVTSVKANDITFLNQGGNIWNGSITALEGIHSVNVSAVDGAGNVAWNNSTSYTAVTPDIIPPSSITDLQATIGTTWVNWTWQNPKDTDFNHTEIYLNGTFQTNTSAEYFNSIGLQTETSYKLGTRTVDINGNVNETWVNSTIMTSKLIPPVADFTANETAGTAPLTVKFTDTSTNSPNEWSWEFGDGSTSIEQNPENTFSTEGVYTVNLTATNGNGSSDVKSMVVTVNRVPTPPVANFIASLTVKFTDTSTNSPTGWKWNFGDGSTSIEQNPVHVYNGEGTYNVTLVTTNAGGSSDVRSMDITVNSVLTPPVANFAADKTEGTTPLTVKFTDKSTNSPTGWAWNFGDGTTTSTAQSPEHTFNGAGTYTVTLVATNADGHSNEKSMDITVNSVLTPPVANFAADKTEGTTPLTVKFTDKSTNSPTGWAWNFGDGSTSTAQSPEHTFNGAGTYTVTLVATNADGHSNEKSMVVTVNRVPTPPVANFTANKTEGTTPLTVKFTDKSTNSPTGWIWNFGDGTTTSTVQNPEHTYATAGTFTANLTASNADGTDATSKTITVTAASVMPKASFTAVPSFGRAPLTVKFTDTSVNETGRTWNFGDGATSTDAKPSHIYKTTGFYTVKLTATNGGNSNVASKTIYVAR